MPGHNASLGDVTIHRLVTSQSIAWRRLSPSLGDVTMGHPRPRHSPQQRRRRPSTAIWAYRSTTAHSIPPSLVLCSAPVFHASHRGLGRVFPGPRWVALAAADVSRHIRPEGSLANTSCLPWRLQDKVPQALPTPQHCWPALWAPLLPATGRPRQRLARSGGSSPIFLP